MSKFLYFCSLLATLFLLAGSYLFPNDVIMWFASTVETENIVRGLVACLLVLLMFTLPPRRWYFRVALGLVAVGLGAWTGYGFQAGSLEVLDLLLYAQLSVVFCLAALELNYEQDMQPVVSRHYVPAS
jgi:hypothetical protein